MATSWNGHQTPKTTRKGRISSMPKIAQVFERTRNGRNHRYYSAFGGGSGLTGRVCTRLQPISTPKLGGFKLKRPRNAKNHFRGQNYAPNRYRHFRTNMASSCRRNVNFAHKCSLTHLQAQRKFTSAGCHPQVGTAIQYCVYVQYVRTVRL